MTERTSSPPRQTIFSQIDVTNLVSPPESSLSVDAEHPERFHFQQTILQQQMLISQQKQRQVQAQQQHAELMGCLRELIGLQRRQNDFLTQIINIQTSSTRQRIHEMHQWKVAHPELARECRAAIDMLGRVQAEYYTKMVDEIESNGDSLEYGDYMINEFIDRFGPRVVHLNGLIQILAQLAMTPEEEATLRRQEDTF